MQSEKVNDLLGFSFSSSFSTSTFFLSFFLFFFFLFVCLFVSVPQLNILFGDNLGVVVDRDEESRLLITDHI